MLNTELKNKINISLHEIKSDFRLRTVELLNYSLESEIHKPMVYGQLGKEYPIMFDKNHASQIITQSFEYSKNPIFDDYSFHFKLKGIENINDERGSFFYNRYLEVQNKSFNKFWDLDSNINQYNEVADFNCFLDLTLNTIDAEKYLKNNSYQVFNYEGWFNFFKTLLECIYEDYSFDKKKSDSKIRFLKQLNDNIYLGFEYDLKELKYLFKKGSLTIPEIDIILIDEKFKKNTKYLKLTNETIWSLCSLEHPFFNLKANLTHLYFRYTLVEKSKNFFERKNLAIKELLDDGRTRIYNSNQIGEELKKFAFYEMVLTSLYKRTFLEYIEKSILNAINK